jgi:hypothetical protein
VSLSSLLGHRDAPSTWWSAESPLLNYVRCQRPRRAADRFADFLPAVDAARDRLAGAPCRLAEGPALTEPPSLMTVVGALCSSSSWMTPSASRPTGFAAPFEQVDRLLKLGARLIDVLQGPETSQNPDTWTVSEDLESNVLCVTSSTTLSGWE